MPSGQDGGLFSTRCDRKKGRVHSGRLQYSEQAEGRAAAHESAREAALEMKRINAMLRQQFGKARAHMTLSELQQLKQHLRRLVK